MPNLYDVLQKIEKKILLALTSELAKFWKQNQYTKKSINILCTSNNQKFYKNNMIFQSISNMR